MDKEKRREKFLSEYPDWNNHRNEERKKLQLALRRKKSYEKKLSRYERLKGMIDSGQSRKEVADKEGISQERVRQILNKPPTLWTPSFTSS